MDICPNAIAWGTVGEWVGALVALFVGIAVIRLSAQTNKVAAEAHATNARIATDQAREIRDRALRAQRKSDLILQSMIFDVGYLADRLDRLGKWVGGPNFRTAYAASEEVRAETSERLGHLVYGALRQQVPHAVELDNQAASDLLTLVQGLDTMIEIAREAAGASSGEHQLVTATMLTVTIDRLRPLAHAFERKAGEAAERLAGVHHQPDTAEHAAS